MDRIRTLLLARTHTVVLEPDRVASAATRPSRDVDLERFEDELAQLGFVMSLDLAMTVRRLPYSTIQELKTWITATLAQGARRQSVPLARGSAEATPYMRRMLTWLATNAEQPCPWCARIRAVGALEPCGHLVCRECWTGGTFSGCPICHRRVAQPEPFGVVAGVTTRVDGDDGKLQLVHLAFDVVAATRARLERLLARPAPLSASDRTDVEETIDVIGPKAAIWMPARIPVRETMAIAVGRLWLVAPDRSAMMKATRAYLETATDVLRVAVVLMGGDPGLGHGRLRSIGRTLRRAVLEALDDRDPAVLVDEVMRHATLWKRVGERLHPYEYATRLPTAALAFAAVRGTDLAAVTFGARIHERIAGSPGLAIDSTLPSGVLRGPAEPGLAIDSGEHATVHPVRWRRAVEEALRAGDATAAVAALESRPGELLRRADHLLRVTPAELRAPVLAVIERAIAEAPPRALLVLGAHVATRTAAWPRRVFVPAGAKLRAWVTPDHRPPLACEAIEAITRAVYGELVRRAESRRQFARAIVDRALADHVLPFRGDRVGAMTDVTVIGAHPTLWDVACIHAAARANIVYIRERDGTIATFRRHDGETALARFSRLLARTDPDATHARIPLADAPTLVVLAAADLSIPRNSTGYIHGLPTADLSPLRLLADLRRTI